VAVRPAVARAADVGRVAEVNRGVLRWVVIGGLILVAGLLVSSFGSQLTITVVTQAGAICVAVIGYNLVVGETGMLSLGQAAFMGLGVYGYAITASRGWGALWAVGFSVILGIGVAVAIGLLTLRLKDVYFAIGTFCAAGIVQDVISQLTSLTGGDQGIAVPPFNAFGLNIGGSSAVYPWVIGSLIVAVALHELLVRGPLGRKMRCIRGDEEAASSMGIPLMRYKVLIFVLGGVFAIWGGLLYGLALEYVDPTVLGVDQTTLILVMLVVGGSGSVVGAIIGAFLITLVPQLLQPLATWWQFIYGLIVVLCVLAARRGLAGLGAQAAVWVRSRLWPRVRGTHADALANADPTEQPSWAGFGGWSPKRGPGMLTVHDVTKTFGGVAALSDVSVAFEPAAVHAVIGPNGSGKSTLVNVITGLMRPDTGKVVFNGEDMTRLPPYAISRLGIARTYQTPRLFGDVSVLDNVLPMAEVAGAHGRSARAVALSCLSAVGLEAYASDPVDSLPQGHRRLLEISRALALEPSVILMDEPAAGLAGDEWHQLQTLLRELAQAGVGVVVIEHNMPFLLKVSDRITVLRQGRVMADGTPKEVQGNPEVREAYLGSLLETGI
jgi:ABC-type branched-subunit amino acid transport system ATPase component/ABC-type branched-subunit amino acid transport system permease subunit